MTDFDAEAFQGSYTGRQADSRWLSFVKTHADPQGAVVLDVGCGGGIYSRALITLGAERVIGIDASAVSLRDARVLPHPRLSYLQGDATSLPQEDACADLVLARALVHHLKPQALEGFVREAKRCLRIGGRLLIQDRTPKDALEPGSLNHPRGYLFECFPQLVALEQARRYERERLLRVLKEGGFNEVATLRLWEGRRFYPNVEALTEDICARRGRSILHTLTDEHLKVYVALLERQFRHQAPIVELEPWTVWYAQV